MNILPLPKYRKWTMAEVPVGQVVRQKRSENRFMILGVNDDGVHILGEAMSFLAMLNEFTMEDGSPCGVEIR